MKASRPIYLIANADDFNLTEGVSKGILESCDDGIVRSTTALINLPIIPSIIRAAKRMKALGVGLHLNITLAPPVSKPAAVRSLIDPDGVFKKRKYFEPEQANAREIMNEYRAQIERFKKVFGKLPSHLDTHHHLHEYPLIFAVVKELALRYRIPVRLSAAFNEDERESFRRKKIASTDRLWEDLDPAKAWNAAKLAAAIRGMKPGVHELMCHPGRCDDMLYLISSFNKRREQELAALCSPAVKGAVRKKGIRLINFREIEA